MLSASSHVRIKHIYEAVRELCYYLLSPYFLALVCLYLLLSQKVLLRYRFYPSLNSGMSLEDAFADTGCLEAYLSSVELGYSPECVLF